MENKITLRNRYIQKIQQKMFDVKKSVDLLSEIDNALVTQTAGARPAPPVTSPMATGPDPTPGTPTPGTPGTINLNSVREKINDLSTGTELRRAIQEKTNTINTSIEQINTQLATLIRLIGERSGELERVRTDIDRIPVPSSNITRT